MAQFDLPLDELRVYAPDLPVPDDLWPFWEQTLAEAGAGDVAMTATPVETGLTLVSTFDVAFSGFGGNTVKGWLHVPAGASGPLPAVVEYVGYGGGRGLAHERVMWATAGYAYFVMDTRGQGSTWSVGATPDPDPAGAPFHPGFMTRGILAPDDYYYRRVFVDAVRAVEAVRAHPVDRRGPGRGHRGQPGRRHQPSRWRHSSTGVAAAMPDVPFLSDFPRGDHVEGRRTRTRRSPGTSRRIGTTSMRPC